jgi:sugar/nucleoside kinase (ribokinase family)
MKLGAEALAPLYKRSALFFCNKEEAERILALPMGTGIPVLLEGLRALGPDTVVISDGRAGAYAFDGSKKVHVPMYPDSRAPLERTGAGDAFASTVTVALSLGKHLDEALLWGPINSMAVVQEVGAQAGLLSREALERFLADAPEDYRLNTI